MPNLLFCAHTLCMNYVTKTFLLPINVVNNKMHETLCCFCQGRSLACCACRVTRIVNFRQCFVFFTLKAFEVNSAEQVVKFETNNI